MTDNHSAVTAAELDVRAIAYEQIKRMKAAGESHEMCARWISEAITPALASLRKQLNEARERADKFMWQVRDTCVRAEKAEASNAQMAAALRQARGALLLDAMLDELGKPYGTTVVALEAIDAALPNVELCDDEGCPHHGTPHVCSNRATPASQEAPAAPAAACRVEPYSSRACELGTKSCEVRHPASPSPGLRDECCHKTVQAHCEDCPYVPVERCTCFRCIRALASRPVSEREDGQ